MNRSKTISFLGIDGSGKSTVSAIVEEEIKKLGFNTKIVPFHRWLFSHKLKEKFGVSIDKGRESMVIPYRQNNKLSISAIVKPLIAFIDNLFFYIKNFPQSKNEIVIFDRFICATQIKFGALNYNNSWFASLWMSFSTDLTFVFDVPEEISVERQKSRGDSYYYKIKELSFERIKYLEYAKKVNAKIIDTNMKSKNKVIDEVLVYIKESI